MNYLIRLANKEYEETVILERMMSRERKELPQGNIQTKRIKGKEYYYLQFRVGEQVKSIYVKKSEIDKIRKEIEHRKELEERIKIARKRLAELELVVDKDEINLNIIKRAVTKIAKEYPEITKFTLFGSRARGNYRVDSDVDLLFETDKVIGLFKQSEIRLRIEEELGLSVDMVSAPISTDSFLDIDKEIVLYAT